MKHTRLSSFLKRPLNLIGVLMILLVSGLAIFAHKIAPYPPNAYSFEESFESPSSKHWLGTDNQGRDVASRLIYGARVSLQVSLVSVGIYVLIGVIVGALAGYFGGFVDLLLSRINEIMSCFPALLLLLALMAFLPPSLYTLMIVLGVTGWPSIARLVRGEVLKQRTNDYVLAARTQGAGSLRILFLHILPNSLTPVFVSATFGVASAILIESSLSFLGLGAAPSMPSWGAMISESNEFMEKAWWLTLFPGLALLLTIFAYNLVGEGLQEAFDPKR